MKVRYTLRARLDLESAFLWYENQRKNLGFEFLDSVETAINYLHTFPEKNSVIYARFRRQLIHRFPFSIFYTIEENQIIIHSIFDNRQDPETRPN